MGSGDMLAAAMYNVYFGFGAYGVFFNYLELSKTSGIYVTLKPYLGSKNY